MYKLKVLISDDDHVFCKLTAGFIRNAGFEVHTASSLQEAHQLLASQTFDLMMQDMCFPAVQDGFGILQEVHERYPAMPVLMISGSGHIPDAVNAIKSGAADFMEKPLAKEHLLLRLKCLSENLKIKRSMRAVQMAAIGMTGTSPAMQKVYDAIIGAAQFDTPVLITGDTGVGKELAALAIHRLSNLSQKPMVSINCASIPQDLFEAELFGYEKGAFTGAVTAKAGYFEYAAGTSILLDEIGELPMAVQAKLLRAISENEIQKLGGKTHKIKTRLICASNRNLLQMIEAGHFRNDLYYRISSINIQIPRLSERREDIIPLTECFINAFCKRNQIPLKTLSPKSAVWLLEQDFTGNVRELKNIVERAVVFGKKDQLNVVDFTKEYSLPETGRSYRDAVLAFEKQHLESVLRIYDGNISQAALFLQMDKSNLSKKLNALGISIMRK